MQMDHAEFMLKSSHDDVCIFRPEVNIAFKFHVAFRQAKFA